MVELKLNKVLFFFLVPVVVHLVVVDVTSQVRRCLYGGSRCPPPKRRYFTRSSHLRVSPGFQSLPRKVDSHFIER